MRRMLFTAAGVILAAVLGYAGGQAPSPAASAQSQGCATQPAVVCVPMTVTPGPSMTPTATNTAVPSVTAKPSATATPQATATEVLDPTPTPIVSGPTWTPGPSPTQGPLRYGLYTPFNQQRVRACPAVDDINCPRVAWIGGGSTWAVWAEENTGINSIWLFIEDRARFISGWVAYQLSGFDYGVYVHDDH